MQCTGSLLLLFFQLPYHYFGRQKVLTQWAQPSLHYPRSYHHYFLLVPIRCLLVFKWMSTVHFSCFFFFFFNFHMVFFSPQTCVDSVGATIFTFPVVIQLNVFIAVPNHFVFFGIAKFSFYKFQLQGGNAVIFHACHENDLKTKQTEPEGI